MTLVQSKSLCGLVYYEINNEQMGLAYGVVRSIEIKRRILKGREDYRSDEGRVRRVKVIDGAMIVGCVSRIFVPDSFIEVKAELGEKNASNATRRE